jgi:phenylacetate-coenzyme A ligase PaaK-like adenylate-forming protein
MPIIGKLIKKSTEISYRKNRNKGKEYTIQIDTLSTLVDYAKNTQFGLVHNFHAFLVNKDIVPGFQQAVPITDYEEFYEKWLTKSIAGEKNHTWPGRIKFYALSSGTTGSPSKRIPVTDKTIRSFQKSSIRQLSILHELDLPETFFSTQVLTVGGSTKLVKKKTHVEGDLSGILKKHTSIVATPFTRPGNKIAGIKDWNERLKIIVEKAPKWNIGAMVGIPSWCILLLEEIVKHYQLNSIQDIWPNFQVYVHGGVFMEPYIARLEKISSKKLFLLDTYLASEGYFAYQASTRRKGMKLLLNTGIFYEFVPFNSDFFDENGVLINKHTAYSLSEVTEGVDYALIITTNAGLWRYMIGDLVRFVDVSEREIIITGRIKQFLSLCGEHLTLDNINQAILAVSQDLSIEITEFSIGADEENSLHHWYFGTNKPESVDATTLMHLIDKKLGELNDDYAYARKYTLKNPVPHVLHTDQFYHYLNSLGKAGSQTKFPRVMKKDQFEQWRTFLEK